VSTLITIIKAIPAQTDYSTIYIYKLAIKSSQTQQTQSTTNPKTKRQPMSMNRGILSIFTTWVVLTFLLSLHVVRASASARRKLLDYGSSDSCANSCAAGVSPGGVCHCDLACDSWDDCCTDYNPVCVLLSALSNNKVWPVTRSDSGFNLAQGDYKDYYVYAYACTTVDVQISASSGDLDLYTKLGGDIFPVETGQVSVFDCRPYLSTADESCLNIAMSPEQTLFIRVFAFWDVTDAAISVTISSSSACDASAGAVPRVSPRRVAPPRGAFPIPIHIPGDAVPGESHVLGAERFLENNPLLVIVLLCVATIVSVCSAAAVLCYAFRCRQRHYGKTVYAPPPMTTEL
jgi:hypothetical protein